MARIFFSTYLGYLLCGLSSPAWAAFTNYHSVLIGSRTAGMGGAGTALPGDPAAAPYYNPALIARLEGSSLSASVSLYNKYETLYGTQNDFGDAPLRIHQGAILPIPAVSGSVYSFGNFAVALSIVNPDFASYIGNISETSNSEASTYLVMRDESLWIGGNLALNITSASSIGLTIYYTSRSATRSLTDRWELGGETFVANEEIYLKNNLLVYALGAYHQLSPQWSAGLSLRFNSFPVSSSGEYFRSEISTGGTSTVTKVNTARVRQAAPGKISVGVAYEKAKRHAATFDLSYHFPHAPYSELAEPGTSGARYEFRPVWNAAIGGEHYVYSWLSVRLGIFTNLSSQKPLATNGPLAQRLAEHIDQFGFSANVGIHTRSNSDITLGGYYSGGRGRTVEQIGGSLTKINKSLQTFSFLVGTGFAF